MVGALAAFCLQFFKQLQEADASASLPKQDAPLFQPMDQTLDEAEQEAATSAMAKAASASAMDVSEFAAYAVSIDDAELKKVGATPTTISQKRKAGKVEVSHTA